MNKIRKSAASFCKKRYFPLFCFAAAITLFTLFFTRYFIKMDDGNFLGIVNAPDFTYVGWLTERYNTLSGRTVGEFLLAFFLRRSLVFWQLINSALIVYMSYFWSRFSDLFAREESPGRRTVFACCGMFLMLVSCLNPSVFWYAGSFTYLWPFAAMTASVSPLVFYVFGEKPRKISVWAAIFAAFVGTAQEQASVCTLALFAVLAAAVIIRKIRFRAELFLPLIPAALCSYSLLTAPGAAERASGEAATNFPRYTEMGMSEKLFCGVSVFFANSFYLSNFLILLLIALMSLALYHIYGHKKLFVAINVFACAVCIPLNYALAAVNGGLAHVAFRKAFLSGEFTGGFAVLFALGCVLLAAIIAMSAALIIKEKRLGFTVALCLAAGFGCAIMMSFTPSIFASGQRAYFFTNMFVITACCALFASVRKSKTADFLYKAAVFYASATFVINCFAFRLAEHPLMG